MAPLPASNTARYNVYYKANGRKHKVTFRYISGSPAAEPELAFRNNITVFLNAVSAYMPNDLVYLNATYSDAGSNVELPATLPLLLVTGLTAARSADAPGYLSIVGKSPAGRRYRKTILGVSQTPVVSAGAASDYRITVSESAFAAAIITALQGVDDLTIDGQIPILNPYLNLGYNAYVQSELRT